MEVASQILLGLIGFSSGFIVAGGVIALITGLGIITRYAGITHTGKHVLLYEDAILLGSLFGNLLTVHGANVLLGGIGLGVMGLFSGVFVGSWILALAEVVNIFPVFSRRIGLTKGMSLVVLSVAIGKVAGSMLHFYMRW